MCECVFWCLYSLSSSGPGVRTRSCTMPPPSGKGARCEGKAAERCKLSECEGSPPTPQQQGGSNAQQGGGTQATAAAPEDSGLGTDLERKAEK